MTKRTDPIKVLICDDSALVRLFLKAIVDDAPNMVVVALARDGIEAVEMARRHKPDVITMDVDMPRLDGLSALKIIVAEGIAPTVMISSLTEEGATQTLEALDAGAFDFLPKPQGKAYFGQASQITAKLMAAAFSGGVSVPGDFVSAAEQELNDANATEPPQSKDGDSDCLEIPPFFGVALGASTGGPKALVEVISKIPDHLDAAFFVVQHIPNAFISPFTKRLSGRTSLECRVSREGDIVRPRTVYVAQGSTHMTLERSSKGEIFIRHRSEPRTLFIPSVNVTMLSVAKHFCQRGIGVILTGMGNDGAEGMRSIKQNGGVTLAESAETAVVFGMPKEAIKRGGVMVTLPLHRMASKIVDVITQNRVVRG